jgi:sigma-B regulation protein RsbU (phosphoserine phosphatase)
MDPHLEAKLLYRRLTSLLGALDPERPPAQALVAFVEDFFESLHQELRLGAAALYAEQHDGFARLLAVGIGSEGFPETLSPGLRPLALAFQHGVYIFSDAEAAGSAFPETPAAAFAVGRRPRRHVVFFLLSPGFQLDQLDFALNTVRAALGARMVEAGLRGSLRQAAEIQASLLPEEPPAFPGFEIAARSQPAEEVGGDFYDFHTHDEDLLGFALGDASGHGLPAALLVRDVVTGLRMGLERELKVEHVFAKLNRVIHQSNLSSRFVSMFYGELDREGTLVYVNAGHEPPMIFPARSPRGRPPRVIRLTAGGTVVGPLAEVRYRRGVAHVRPGETLLLLTDGVLERRSPSGEFFGEERVIETIHEARGAPVAELVERLFARAQAFGEGRPFDDDATVLTIRREA